MSNRLRLRNGKRSSPIGMGLVPSDHYFPRDSPSSHGTRTAVSWLTHQPFHQSLANLANHLSLACLQSCLTRRLARPQHFADMLAR